MFKASKIRKDIRRNVSESRKKVEQKLSDQLFCGENYH